MLLAGSRDPHRQRPGRRPALPARACPARRSHDAASEVGQRCRRLEALRQPQHAVAAGGRGARRPGRSPGRPGDRSRRCAASRCRGTRAARRRARATPRRRADARRRPPRSRASSEPWRRSRSAAVLAPIPGAPGRPSDGSPRSAMKSGTSSGTDPVALDDLGGVDLLKAARALLEIDDRDRLGLAHWYMSRSPVMISARPPAADSASASDPSRSSASSSSEPIETQPNASNSAADAVELPLQRVGHRRPRRVIVGIQLLAVDRRLGAPADDDRARPCVGRDPQDQVDGAEQRVDRMAVAVGDRVRQREE